MAFELVKEGGNKMEGLLQNTRDILEQALDKRGEELSLMKAFRGFIRAKIGMRTWK